MSLFHTNTHSPIDGEKGVSFKEERYVDHANLRILIGTLTGLLCGFAQYPMSPFTYGRWLARGGHKREKEALKYLEEHNNAWNLARASIARGA